MTFIELHAIEFGSQELTTTPISVQVAHIKAYQSVTQRMRRQLMESQVAHNKHRESQGQEAEPLKELPANCSVVQVNNYNPNLPNWPAYTWVEESYSEIKWKIENIDKD